MSTPYRISDPLDVAAIRAHNETWEVTPSVVCVSCPACAFTFDAVHVDDKTLCYECPACAEIALLARVAELEAALAVYREAEATRHHWGSRVLPSDPDVLVTQHPMYQFTQRLIAAVEQGTRSDELAAQFAVHAEWDRAIAARRTMRLESALPHLLEAVVGEIGDDQFGPRSDFGVSREWFLGWLQRAAARLNRG